MTGPLEVLAQVPLARTLIAGTCGAMVGVGAWTGVAAVRGWLPDRSFLPSPLTWVAGRLPTPVHRAAAVSGVLIAVLATILVRLPVVGVLVLGAVWVGLDLIRGPSLVQMNELGAGVAAWSETVRQELEAGRPQRAALIAACDLPPPGLEDPLAVLAERLEHRSIPEALWGFARDVHHPAVGHVVAALDVAYRYGAADLPRLMAGQVETTRHQVQMAREIHAARAKHRRVMVLLIVLFFLVVTGLFIVWPQFLAAYRGLRGQLILAAIGGSVLIAVHSLVRLSHADPPVDFFTGPATNPPDPGQPPAARASFQGGGPS